MTNQKALDIMIETRKVEQKIEADSKLNINKQKSKLQLLYSRFTRSAVRT